jgi:transposase
VRVTTAFNRLLDLDGVNVTRVVFEPDAVAVTVALCRSRLVCPECGWSTPSRYDERPVDSLWRHLDMGRWRLEVRARLRRLWCPTHGARTEGVPFARPGSDFTADFESLVAWLATRTDKTAITRLVRVTWRTVGRIIGRVVADELDSSIVLADVGTAQSTTSNNLPISRSTLSLRQTRPGTTNGYRPT